MSKVKKELLPTALNVEDQPLVNHLCFLVFIIGAQTNYDSNRLLPELKETYNKIVEAFPPYEN